MSADIRSIVRDVLAGTRMLDVPTARTIIDSAVRDKRIVENEELAPIRDLFIGTVAVDAAGTTSSKLKLAVKHTVTGKKLLESFLYNAENYHAAHGDGRSRDVRKLKQLAMYDAVALTSDAALIPLLHQYEKTIGKPYPPDYKYIPYTHEHTANYDIEAVRLNAAEALSRYVKLGPIYRFFVGDRQKAVVEYDPLQKVREYLEGNYVRKS